LKAALIARAGFSGR